MNLRAVDVGFIVVIASLAGFGGAALYGRYFAPEPFQHKVVVFDSGAFTVRRMAAKQQASGEIDAAGSIRDVAAITQNLARQGFIVIDNQAVLAAPQDYYLADEDAAQLTTPPQ